MPASAGPVFERLRALRTELARQADVPVPISAEVHAVLHEGRSALQAYRGLRRTAPTSEIEGVA